MKQSTLFISFAATAILSVLIGFFTFSPEEAGLYFGKLGYWNILLCFACFSTIILRTFRDRLSNWLCDKKHWPILALAVIATVFLYTREGGGFKITFDEHSISNVARTMHFDRVATLNASSIPDFDETSSIDKRPLLFHFLLATSHDIFGYRIENAFYLNAFLLAVLFLLLHTILAKIYDARAGYISIILICCWPIFEQNASGGGLEITNLVGILTCLLLALLYGEKPTCNARFSSLIIAITLFSHARYESPFFIIPVAATILYYWVKNRRIQITWTSVIAPLFFITYAWQFSFSNANDSLKQLKYDSDGVFSLSYINQNLGHALNFLLSSGPFSLNSLPLAIAGVISFTVITAICITRNKKLAETIKRLHVVQFFALAIIAETILILGFTYGQFDDPIVTRLGMPFILMITCCTALLLSFAIAKKPKSSFAIYALIGACFIYIQPTYSNHRYTTNNATLRCIEWVYDHHKNLPLGNHLYISYVGQDMQLRGVGNINYRRAVLAQGFVKMHKELKTWDDVFVVQSGGIRFTTTQEFEKFIIPSHDISPWYELETIDEISLSPFTFTRISRVQSILPSDDDNIDATKAKEAFLTEPIKVCYEIDPETYDAWLDSIP